MSVTAPINAPEIARRNDQARQFFFNYMLTPGIQTVDDFAGLLKAVRSFDAFTVDMDPYSEHDFISLTWEGRKVFAKIDYYDKNLEYGTDPLDPECRRIVTVMLAEEY